MRAGELRHRVTVQQELFTKDTVTGENVSGWQDVCTVWAAVEPVRGREYFRTFETHSRQTTRIRIRYRSGITSDMRVKFGDDIAYIHSVINFENKNQELLLVCVAKNPPGPGE
jgi:phage head-tail adaptor, putative, SPP1 family